jgi:phenylacetic acid degradation operon negative regulatory protein
VRLRDPQLPIELLPRGWPGARAYALCRNFYRLAKPAAETHLAAAALADGERLPRALAQFDGRFAARVASR